MDSDGRILHRLRLSLVTRGAQGCASEGHSISRQEGERLCEPETARERIIQQKRPQILAASHVGETLEEIVVGGKEQASYPSRAGVSRRLKVLPQINASEKSI